MKQFLIRINWNGTGTEEVQGRLARVMAPEVRPIIPGERPDLIVGDYYFAIVLDGHWSIYRKATAEEQERMVNQIPAGGFRSDHEESGPFPHVVDLWTFSEGGQNITLVSNPELDG